MNCTEFRQLIVSDDAGERQRALQHAAECGTCAEVLAAHEALALEVERWKSAVPAPPAHLEQQLLGAIRREKAKGPGRAEDTVPSETLPTTGRARPSETADETPATGGRLIPRRRLSAWPRPVWAAAGALAAMVTIASLVAVRAFTWIPAPDQAERLLVADALREAEAAERAHARAIAQLELAARPILAKAEDPAVSGRYAALLMSYRSRLEFLDQTIADINGFLEENPGHPGARTMLLAAYTEKTDVLRDLIALEEERSS